MKRFYYFTPSLASVRGITRDLSQAGIGENRLHVMGNDGAAMSQAGVNRTTPWEETDIMPAGFQGTLLGLIVGTLVGFLLAGADPWGVDLGMPTLFISAVFGASFGAWAGGLLGLSKRNHHLAPYMDRVKQGDYLMMVDADDPNQAGWVENVMWQHRHEAEQAGRDDAFSPLD